MKGLRHEGSREGSQEAIQHEMAPPIPGSLIGRQMNSFFLKLFPFLKILPSDTQSVARNQVSVWAICLLSNSCYPIHGHELALGSLCWKIWAQMEKNIHRYCLWRAMRQGPGNTAKPLRHAHFNGCICDMPSPWASLFIA